MLPIIPKECVIEEIPNFPAPLDLFIHREESWMNENIKVWTREIQPCKNFKSPAASTTFVTTKIPK
jgi:hypothetical protein